MIFIRDFLLIPPMVYCFMLVIIAPFSMLPGWVLFQDSLRQTWHCGLCGLVTLFLIRLIKDSPKEEIGEIGIYRQIHKWKWSFVYSNGTSCTSNPKDVSWPLHITLPVK